MTDRDLAAAAAAAAAAPEEPQMERDRAAAIKAWKKLICNANHERIDRELHQLSEDERSQVYNDLGGAQDMSTEHPHEINEALLQLDDEIAAIPQKEAFLRAQGMTTSPGRPSYTDSAHFRLRFLRADTFDAKKAARRFVQFFEERLDLFGPQVGLGKECITIDDLSEDDLEALECGGLQVLPHKDQFYRGVVGVGYSVGEIRQGWRSDPETSRRLFKQLLQQQLL